jgi:mono/diheme cytochrome c family protein
MNRFSATWRSAAYLGLSLTVVVWAAAHGAKNWPAPEEAKKLKNPVPNTADSLAAAKVVYADNCAQCHGEAGKGDGPEAPMYDVKPADFSDAHMMGEMTEGEIFWKISEGRRPMPSFKKQLTDEQRWQLVNYLRTLAPKPAAAPKSTHAPAKTKVTRPKQ